MMDNVLESKKRQDAGAGIMRLFMLIMTAMVFSLLAVFFSFQHALVILFGVVVLYLVWRNPEWGVYIIIFLLPFGIISGFLGFFTPVKLMGFATVIIWSVRRLLIEKSFVRARQNSVLALFILFVFVSSYFAFDKGAVLSRLKDIFMVAVFYLLIINLIDTRQKYRTLIWVTFLSVGLSSLYGIFSYLFQKQLVMTRYASTWSEFIKVEAPVERIHGASNFGPNVLGAMFCLLLPMAIILFFWSRRKLDRSFLLGIIVIFFISDLFTLSRGSWVALAAVSPLVLLRIREKIRFSGKSILLLVIIGGGALLLLPGRILDRARSITDIETDMSIRSRLSYKTAAFHMLMDHPFTGVGPGNYFAATASPEYMDLVYNPERREDTFIRQLGIEGRAAHDMYCEVMAELGLPGISLFLVLLGLTLSSIRRARNSFVRMNDPSFLAQTYALQAGLICIMINGLFLHSEYLEYLWLTFGLGVVLERFATDEKALLPTWESG